MPLVKGIDILQKAHEENYAVGAFNFNNMEFLQAIIKAAEEVNSPVIVQATEGAIKYAGIDMIVAMVKALADKSKVPVALHLDHGKKFEVVMQALRAGFTSVMIDASDKPFEENLAITKKIVEIAHAMGVSVEAELGKLMGVEDNVVSRESVLVNPDEAEQFVKETGVDYLAPAIGTSHGAFKFKGEGKIDIERLKEVKKRTGIPLVLHGASAVPQDILAKAEKYGAQLGGAKGVPLDQLKAAVENGINKVNVDTDLRICYLATVREVLTNDPKQFDPRKYLGPARESLVELIKERMQFLGSAGKNWL